MPSFSIQLFSSASTVLRCPSSQQKSYKASERTTAAAAARKNNTLQRAKANNRTKPDIMQMLELSDVEVHMNYD